MQTFTRLPRHVGIIPDGNRRWAELRDLPRGDGYAAGLAAGVRLLSLLREFGIEEVSVYGFTKENLRRPREQVEAFRDACVGIGEFVVQAGGAFLAVGDTASPLFPEALRRYATERSVGDIRFNLLVNYGWQWDLFSAVERARADAEISYSTLPHSLGSRDVSRIDLVVRWGGHRRLSGFLPVQCAYADVYVVKTLWPDAGREEFLDALVWYQEQDVTLGG